MTNNDDSSYTIIRRVDGEGTGDRMLQTADGRWWVPSDGQIETGYEIHTFVD